MGDLVVRRIYGANVRSNVAQVPGHGGEANDAMSGAAIVIVWAGGVIGTPGPQRSAAIVAIAAVSRIRGCT